MFKILRETKKLFFRKAALKNYIERKYLLEGLPEDQITDKLKAIGHSEKKIKLTFFDIKHRVQEEQEKRKREKWDREGTFFIEKGGKTKGIKTADLLNLALRIFKVKPGRTILTILGIGVSFGTIFFLVSLGYGLEQILLQQISSEESLLSMDVTSSNPEILPLNTESLQEILKIQHIKKIDPVGTVSGQAEFAGFASEAEFFGVSDGFFKLSALELAKGRFFEQGEREIVAPSIFLEAFGLDDMDSFLNQEINLVFYIPRDVNGIQEVEVVTSDKTFKIVGIIDNQISNSIYLPIDEISKFDIPFGLVKVVVDKNENMEDVRANIMNIGYSTSAIADTIDQADKIFNVFQIIMALFGLAALVVAVIGMINTMTIALLERIQEIGIMKVMSVSERDIKRLFLSEAAIMGFLGGLSGLLIGFLGSQVFNIAIGFLARTLGGQSVDLFFYPTWFIVTIILFSSIVGFVTGVMPSRKAAKLDPLQALRYK